MTHSDDGWKRFRCEVEPERDVVRVVPIGELDLATVGQVQSEVDGLREAGFTHIVLDLRRLTFMDSSGLQMILAAEHSAGESGATFQLIPGPESVQQVFELAGVVDRLAFCSPDAQDG